MPAAVAARTIRAATLVLAALGIAGVVAGSIADSIGLAMTCGVIAAVAIVCLLLVTAAAGPGAFGAAVQSDPDAAADLERRIARLVANGADEVEIRSLVRAATRFGRRAP